MACYGDSTDRAELASFYKKLGYPKIATNLIFCLKGLASYTKNKISKNGNKKNIFIVSTSIQIEFIVCKKCLCYYCRDYLAYSLYVFCRMIHLQFP